MKAFREGRVPQPGPPESGNYDTTDRPNSPPSDLEESSVVSSQAAASETPAASVPVPPSASASQDIVSPRKFLESKLAGSIPKTPIRGPGLTEGGVWSTVATPGSETPGVSLTPFALLAALNGSHQSGSPKPRSSLANSSKPNEEDGDTDDDGDGGWSTVGNNPFSRQNSMAISRQGSFAAPGVSPALPNFTTHLVSLNEEGTSSTTLMLVKLIAVTDSPPRQPLPLASLRPDALNVPLPPSAAASTASSPAKPAATLAKSPGHPSAAILPMENSYKVDINVDDVDQRKVRFTPSVSGGLSDAGSVGSPPNNKRLSLGSVGSGSTMVTVGANTDGGKSLGGETTTSRSSTSTLGGSINGEVNGKTDKLASSPSNPSPLSHARTPSVTVAKPPVIPAPPTTRPRSASEIQRAKDDEEWERVSRARLSRLPDSRDTSDNEGGSGSGDHGELNGAPFTNGSNRPTTRRNTIRASDPSTYSPSLPSFNLPGVPSTLPTESWPSQASTGDNEEASGSFPQLPSAPPLPPGIDTIPHVEIHTRPRPEHGRSSSSNDTIIPPPSFTPTHTRGASSTSDLPTPVQHLPPAFPPHSQYSQQSQTPSPPPPPSGPPPHFSYNSATTTPSTATSTIPPMYAPPNSAVSQPTTSLNGYSPPGSSTSVNQYPYPGPPVHSPYGHHPQYPSDPQFAAAPPTWPGHHPSWPPAPPVGVPYHVPQNGLTGLTHPMINNFADGSSDGYGARTPPSVLEPEIVAKAQKHAKFALSALNFEDLETAREELKRALRLLS